MKMYYFSLSVSYTRCQEIYLEGGNTVVLHAETGERVQIPSVNLRPFIGTHGIQGRFRLIIDNDHKLKSFERVA